MGFEHVESKCGHVSMVILGHSEQFGFGCRLGQKIFLRWLPIYWAYQTSRVCVIWASVIPGFFLKPFPCTKLGIITHVLLLIAHCSC